MSIRGLARRLSKTMGYHLFPKLRGCSEVRTKILGKGDHYFVGYHDHDPISIDGSAILCHRIDRRFTGAVEPEHGEVGLMAVETGEFKSLAMVEALNWQLGSRVQWFKDETIIFNDISEDKHCSRIIDSRNGAQLGTIPWPFWAISPDKRLGVSLNFAKLRINRPGYGYRGESPDGDRDLLRVFEINSQRIIAEYTLADIIRELDIQYSENDEGYFNHICWNRDSNKFITLLCWESSKLNRRINYGILFDLAKGELQLLNTTGFFSHHTWLKRDRLVAYLDVGGKTGYHVWEANEGWREFGFAFPQEDGHPTSAEEQELVIVDTYPDKLSRMRLFRCAVNQSVAYEEILTVTNNPLFSGALRCDLHPRFSPRHSRIVCDMPSFDSRKLLIVDV